MNKDAEEREARYKAIEEENARLRQIQARRDSMDAVQKEADRNESFRQQEIKRQEKDNRGSELFAIPGLVTIIVIGILLGA